MSVFEELRRRNVFRVGAAYLAVAWLVLQVISVVNEPLGLPERLDTVVVVLLLVGFPVALVLAWAYELTPQGVRRTEDAPSAGTADASAPAHGSRLNYVIIGVLALTVVILLVDRFVPGAADVNATRQTTATTAADDRSAASAIINTATARIAIAVLPFQNFSSDPDVGYLTDGLLEQVTTTLRGTPELLVSDSRAARTAAAGTSLQEIAAVLGVDYVVEGSVASDGAMWRITARLTHVDDGAQAWADTWDFGDVDTFEVRDEITRAIATALQVSLGVLNSHGIGITTNVEAYNTYLMGVGHSTRFSSDELLVAIERYQRAIYLDPSFFAARIALSTAYREMAIVVPPAEAASWRERSAETLALARELATSDIELTFLDGMESILSQNWGDAAVAIARLDALGFDAPGRAAALGSIYYATGHLEEAVNLLEEARAMNPLEPGISATLGGAYAALGDNYAAQAEFDRGIALAADGRGAALISGATWITALGAHDRELFERRLRAFPSAGGIAEAMLDLFDDPEAALTEIRRRLADDENMLALNKGILAHFAAYFGAPELALEIMRSMPLNEPFLPLMLWDYGEAATRRLPEFRQLVEDMGLVGYWREYGWPDFCRPTNGDEFVCD